MAHSSGTLRTSSPQQMQSDIDSVIAEALRKTTNPPPIIAALPNLDAPNPFGNASGPQPIHSTTNPFGSPLGNPLPPHTLPPPFTFALDGSSFPPALSPQPNSIASTDALKLKLQRFNQLNAPNDPPSDHTLGTVDTIGTVSTFATNGSSGNSIISHSSTITTVSTISKEDDSSIDSGNARSDHRVEHGNLPILSIPLMDVPPAIELTFPQNGGSNHRDIQITPKMECKSTSNGSSNGSTNGSSGSGSSGSESGTPSEHTPHHKGRSSRSKSTWESSHSFVADCHLCNERVENYEEYCNHLKAEHYDVRDDLEWLTCDVCGKENAHKSNFISHLASHTGNKPFKCRIQLRSGQFCATEASTRQNLQTHILKVHKIAVKHKLVAASKQRVVAVKEPKRKRKRKKKSKKRKYEDVDIHFDINDPLYGYTYAPRRSKRRRTKEEGLSMSKKEQMDAPYVHPVEILVAAKLFMERIEAKAAASTGDVTSAEIKDVAANWNQILSESTLLEIKNVANQVDDICSTKQII